MAITTNQEPAGPAPLAGEQAPHRESWRRLRFALRIVQVRLRFAAVLLAAFLIVGNWPLLRNVWDTLTMSSGDGALPRISSDTEYFCPMCPGVVSGWPTHCSVCNMPLVRRKKGEAIHLPDGVLARMQLSPYRVQLAGIRTEPVVYRPLAREVVSRGIVRAPVAGLSSSQQEIEVAAEIYEREIPFVQLGQEVALTSEVFPAHEPWRGRVVDIEPKVSPERRSVQVRLAVDDPGHELWPGMSVVARLQLPLAAVEPFRSQPSNPPPLRRDEPRRVFACPDHPHLLRDERGRCPEDNKLLQPRQLADNQRIGWWCPMHPTVVADRAGASCAECGGMKLLPRVITYRPAGEVLAVPESAVVDTGTRKVVYVERMPGMFDGIEVRLAARCGEFYPVAEGLEAGMRVASVGAFLIDAETRYNPNVAAGYFGAAGTAASNSPAASEVLSVTQDQQAGGTPAPQADAETIRKALARLAPGDRALAERQRICPVTRLPLGSMGPPRRVDVAGQVVFICCSGCENTLQKSPDKYLKHLPAGEAHDGP